MGILRFLVEPASLLDEWPESERAFTTALDGRVFPSRIEREAGILGVRRQSSDSAKLHVAWPVAGAGRPVISTCSLRERTEPYLLATELARGKMNQIREQAFIWATAGMHTPDDFPARMRTAFMLFQQSATRQDRPAEATELANQSLACAFEAAELLVSQYSHQRLQVRRQRSSHSPAVLGAAFEGNPPTDIAASTAFLEAFHAAQISIGWTDIEATEGNYQWDIVQRQVEWCEQSRLVMRAGPLIDLSDGGLPPWLHNWQSDFANVQSFVCDFVETAISQYRGRIRWWEIVARANSGGALALNEDQRLTLTARALDVARRVDDEGELILRVDQPWGEYQTRGQNRLTPLQFVDALVRSGVGPTVINLEISFGISPGSAGARDQLELSRLVDMWSLLGLPLHVTLVVPSSSKRDPLSDLRFSVDPGSWAKPCSEGSQSDVLNVVVPLLMAKQGVVAIFVSHFDDGQPHRFPAAGLRSAAGVVKPGLAAIVHHRLANERHSSP